MREPTTIGFIPEKVKETKKKNKKKEELTSEKIKD